MSGPADWKDMAREADLPPDLVNDEVDYWRLLAKRETVKAKECLKWRKVRMARIAELEARDAQWQERAKRDNDTLQETYDNACKRIAELEAALEKLSGYKDDVLWSAGYHVEPEGEIWADFGVADELLGKTPNPPTGTPSPM
jgi:hypothetical protein